jgi:nucleotide-binding universal stress UspA family protein
MKPILALTDFSAPAENAVLYAARMAESLHTRLILLHVYQIPVSINEMPGLFVNSEDLRINANNNLARMRQIALDHFPGLEIEVQSRLGEVVKEMNEIINAEHPLVVVVGRHEAGSFEKIFFGSVSLSVVRHTTTPVVVVPQGASLRPLKRMALAIDDQVELIPQEKIVTLTRELKAEKTLVHVQKNHTGFPEIETALSVLNAKCTVIHDHEFVHGLKNYIRQNQIDILVVFPHRHSLPERIFVRSHTEEILQDIKIPVMCIGVD